MERNRTNEPAVRVTQVNPRTNDTIYNNSQSGVVNHQICNSDRNEPTENEPEQNNDDRNKLPDKLKNAKNF